MPVVIPMGLFPNRSSAGSGPRRYLAHIHNFPVHIDRLETESITRDFGGNETIGLVVTGSEDGGFTIKVAATQFASRSGNKILHALLWLDAFVGMVVAREGGRHTVFDQQWFEFGAQPQTRPVPIGRRKKRMVKVGDFPN